MELTKQDYIEIAGMVDIDPGTGNIEYEKDGELLYIDYFFDYEGYEENDYYNGTGAYIITSIEFAATMVASSNEDGDETPNNFNEDEIYDLLERELVD